MNKVLRYCIPYITMPFFYDIPIKRCSKVDNDKSLGEDWCRHFMTDHIADCNKVLQRLEDALLTFSDAKSTFGQLQILMVWQLCREYEWKIIEERKSRKKLRWFLSSSAFYNIWIPHYTQIFESLVPATWNKAKIQWENEPNEVMKRLKGMLIKTLYFRKVMYIKRMPIYLTIDTIPIGIGWAINQEGEDDGQHSIRFGAKVLSEWQ